MLRTAGMGREWITSEPVMYNTLGLYVGAYAKGILEGSRDLILKLIDNEGNRCVTFLHILTILWLKPNPGSKDPYCQL